LFSDLNHPEAQQDMTSQMGLLTFPCSRTDIYQYFDHYRYGWVGSPAPWIKFVIRTLDDDFPQETNAQIQAWMLALQDALNVSANGKYIVKYLERSEGGFSFECAPGHIDDWQPYNGKTSQTRRSELRFDVPQRFEGSTSLLYVKFNEDCPWICALLFFRVLFMDNRNCFAGSENFPEGDDVIWMMFDK
jgi:hypothetical protein